MRIIHLVRMWPTKEDPQHGSFIEAHIRETKNIGNETIVIVLGEKPMDSEKESIIYNASRKGPLGWVQKYKSVKSALKILGSCDILHIHGGSWDTAYILIKLKFLYILDHQQKIQRLLIHNFYNDYWLIHSFVLFQQ